MQKSAGITITLGSLLWLAVFTLVMMGGVFSDMDVQQIDQALSSHTKKRSPQPFFSRSSTKKTAKLA